MKPRLKEAIAGWTLVEMLVVIAIIGILSAIVAPSWIALLTRQRLNSAQAEALTVLRETQANAKREKRIWQACFRDDGTNVLWSIQAVPVSGPDDCTNVPIGSWNRMLEENSNSIAIDTTNNATTLLEDPAGYYKMQFQYKGLVNGQLGKITFGSRSVQGQPGVADGSKRCVFVSTLLGVMRAGSNDECAAAEDSND